MFRKSSAQYSTSDEQAKDEPHTPTHLNSHHQNVKLPDEMTSSAPFPRTQRRRGSRLDFLFSPDVQKNLKRNVEQYQEMSQNFVLTASSLSKQFSNLVSTSTGREKVLSVFQYWGEFQCVMAKNSNIPGIQDMAAKNMLQSVRFMFQVKENLSQARKTFRLLKFLDDLKSVQRVLKTKKPFLFKLLGCFAHYCSFMYYISDNILFTMSLFVKSKIVPKERELKWKDNKNSFSLLRVLLSISRHVWSLYLRHKKESILKKQIEQAEDVEITKESQIHSICSKFIKQCRKRRLEQMELAIDICRFFMLYNTLKMPAYKIVDPVYIGFCGVLSSVMSLMKMIIDKKIFVTVESEEKKVQSQIVFKKQISQIINRTTEKDLTSGLTDLDGILGNQYKNPVQS